MREKPQRLVMGLYAGGTFFIVFSLVYCLWMVEETRKQAREIPQDMQQEIKRRVEVAMQEERENPAGVSPLRARFKELRIPYFNPQTGFLDRYVTAEEGWREGGKKILHVRKFKMWEFGTSEREKDDQKTLVPTVSIVSADEGEYDLGDGSLAVRGNVVGRRYLQDEALASRWKRQQ